VRALLRKASVIKDCGLIRPLNGSALWLLIASTAWLMPAFANDWQADLEDGRRISVDLSSNRVQLVTGKGRGAPLWDGVHRLSDGSVITVRSGLMVPNREVLAARDAPPLKRQTRTTASACSQLIDKTCGVHRACESTQGCDLARQLRALQWNRVAPDPAGSDWAEARCRHALADDAAFAPCDLPPADEPGICHRLVRHLCGENNRCAATESCEIARQMLELEQAALRDGVADYAVDSRRQCQSAFREHAYFPPCR
jgi:hypothetical protein